MRTCDLTLHELLGVQQLLPSDNPSLGSVFVLADGELRVVLRVQPRLVTVAERAEAFAEARQLLMALPDDQPLQIANTHIGGQRELLLCVAERVEGQETLIEAARRLWLRSVLVHRELERCGLDVEPVNKRALALLRALAQPATKRKLPKLAPAAVFVLSDDGALPVIEPLDVRGELDDIETVHEHSQWLRFGEGRYAHLMLALHILSPQNEGWLQPLLADPRLNVCLRLSPLPAASASARLQEQLAEDEAQADARLSPNRFSDPESAQRVEDARELLSQLREERTRLFQAYLTLTVVGESPEDLWRTCCEIVMQIEGAQWRDLGWSTVDEWRATLPLMTLDPLRPSSQHLLTVEQLTQATPWLRWRNTAKLALPAGQEHTAPPSSWLPEDNRPAADASGEHDQQNVPTMTSSTVDDDPAERGQKHPLAESLAHDPVFVAYRNFVREIEEQERCAQRRRRLLAAFAALGALGVWLGFRQRAQRLRRPWQRH